VRRKLGKGCPLLDLFGGYATFLVLAEHSECLLVARLWRRTDHSPSNRIFVEKRTVDAKVFVQYTFLKGQ
jgi:hypothetical protein